MRLFSAGPRTIGVILFPMKKSATKGEIQLTYPQFHLIMTLPHFLSEHREQQVTDLIAIMLFVE